MTLKDARKQILKLTQKQMAEAIGVSERTWIRYENQGCPQPILLLVKAMISQPSKFGVQ